MDLGKTLTSGESELTERLATSGFRFTPQRQHVYGALLQKRDHPTAEEVFIRTKQEHPDISMATVYNCLDALVTCGLVKAVHLSKGATRFCPNMQEHYHFYCDGCGRLFDIDPPSHSRKNPVPMPKGFTVDHLEIAIHGSCPDCSGKVKPA